ncbi:hypothetical protein AVEN_30100-1 [Araneus ventricosus]|uniref:Uncharacterized protein n=1 Tax=Araneus ventricosus TaxID=182803 RepID=A0A4Y2VQR3_ARAVE|nr:hypothetical protein AVEN_30100-1 [Araneus ventricosus]
MAPQALSNFTQTCGPFTNYDCAINQRRKSSSGCDMYLLLVSWKSCPEATRVPYFGTDLALEIMTRATPELGPLLQASSPHQQETATPSYDLTCSRPLHDGS